MNISFYEQVGIIIPGAALLFGLTFLIPELKEVLGRDGVSFGGLGVYLLVAYAAGHLLAAIGNLIEWIFWKLFGGMPSDWVVRPQQELLNADQVKQIRDRLQRRFRLEVPAIASMTVSQWRPYFAQIYRDVLAQGGGRTETFNGNYGLNRGLAASLIALAILYLCLRPASLVLAIALAALSCVHLYRMYRFGIHFAREVYVRFLLLPPNKAEEASGQGG